MSKETGRLGRMQRSLQEEGLAAVLLLSPVATCYLSGCYLLTQTVIPERQAYVLLTAAGDVSYLVCNIEERSARQHSWIEDIRTYVEFGEMPASAAARLLQSHRLTRGRIGIESHTMPAETLAHLQAQLPAVAFVSWDSQLAAHFMVKEPAEVAALEEAGRQTQAAIEAGLTGAAPGSSERQVANRVLTEIMDAGIMPLFNVFAAGPQLLTAHAEATERVLQSGEIVRLDMGGRSPSNYLSDLARTAVVGEPDSVQAQTYRSLYEIQMEVMTAARPGVLAGHLYRICADGFARRGLPFGMPHIGHGMGIGLHEAPMIHPGNETRLEPGMVLNIEPLVALAERGESYHTEDLLVVTEGEPRLLTTPQPELLRIPA